MKKKLLTVTAFTVALLSALSAAGDRLVRLPRGAHTTDDAYVRADLTPLAARVEANVLEVHVHDHQRVKRGELLVDLDASEFVARVQQAEAHLTSAQARLHTLRQRKTAQRATLTATRAAIDETRAQLTQLSTEAGRQRAMGKSGLTSEQELERAVAGEQRGAAELRRREAETLRAGAELEMLDAELLEADAEVRARAAELELAKLELSYTRIVAPADGTVGERAVHPGQLVRPGTPVITLVELDTVWVTANFKENQLASIEPGHPMRVTVDTFPDVPLEGRVDSIAPGSGAQFSLLPPDNATGNFTRIVQRVPVKVLLSVPPALRGRLLPGMSATVTITPG